MKCKRILIVTGMVAALAVPAGVAAAATVGSGPAHNGPVATQQGPGNGPGYGDPDNCPYYNSTEAQQWRDQRAQRMTLTPEQRQQLAAQHRQQMHDLWESSAS